MRNEARIMVHTIQMEIKIKTKATLKGRIRDFHGGPVVKNPLASAEDMGSIPGPGRFHMWWDD